MNEKNSKTAATETTRTWVNGPVISQYARYRTSLIARIATFEGDLIALGALQRAGLPAGPFTQRCAEQAATVTSEIKSLECTGGITSEFAYELVTSVIGLAAEYLPCGGGELKTMTLPPFAECRADAIAARDREQALERRCCSTFRVMVQGVSTFRSARYGVYESLYEHNLGERHDFCDALALYRTASEADSWRGEQEDDERDDSFSDVCELDFCPNELTIRDGYHRVIFMGFVDGSSSYPHHVDEAWIGNEGVARALAAYGFMPV